MRFNEGKPPLDYILDFPRAQEALARVMEYGASKYEKDNWKRGGKPDQEYLGACMRHIMRHKAEGDFDSESGCLHLAHAVWNLMALIELNRTGDVYVSKERSSTNPFDNAKRVSHTSEARQVLATQQDG